MHSGLGVEPAACFRMKGKRQTHLGLMLLSLTDTSRKQICWCHWNYIRAKLLFCEPFGGQLKGWWSWLCPCTHREWWCKDRGRSGCALLITGKLLRWCWCPVTSCGPLFWSGDPRRVSWNDIAALAPSEMCLVQCWGGNNVFAKRLIYCSS